MDNSSPRKTIRVKAKTTEKDEIIKNNIVNEVNITGRKAPIQNKHKPLERKEIIDVAATAITFLALLVAIASTITTSRISIDTLSEMKNQGIKAQASLDEMQKQREISQSTLDEMQKQRELSIEPVIVIDSAIIHATREYKGKAYNREYKSFKYKFEDNYEGERSVALKMVNIGAGVASYINITFPIDSYYNWLNSIISRCNENPLHYSLKYEILETEKEIQRINVDFSNREIVNEEAIDRKNEILFLLPKAENDYDFELPDRYSNVISELAITYDIFDIPPIRLSVDYVDSDETSYSSSLWLQINHLGWSIRSNENADGGVEEAIYRIGLDFGYSELTESKPGKWCK